MVAAVAVLEVETMSCPMAALILRVTLVLEMRKKPDKEKGLKIALKPNLRDNAKPDDG